MNNVIAVLFLLIVLLTLTACDGAESRKSEYLSRGEGYLNNAQYEKARVEFRNVLQIDPKSVQGHLSMGRLYEAQGEHRKALASYHKVVELESDNLHAMAATARIYLLAGYTDKAEALVDDVLKIDASYADALVVRAGVNLRQNKIEDSLLDVRNVLADNPDHVASLALLSRIYVTQQQSEKAEALLVNAYQRKPDSKSLLSLLVQFYNDEKRYDQAISHMQLLLDLDKDNVSYRHQLAYFYNLTENYKEAENVLRDAVKDLPDNILLKRQLIEYLAEKRDLMFAQLELSRFIKDDADNPELQLISAALYQRSKEYDKAETIYRELVRKYGDESSAVTAQYELARLLFAEKREEEAVTELSALLKDHPKHYQGLMLRGVHALQNGDAKTAVDDLRAAVNEQPQSSELHKLLANAYLIAGELDLAEQTLRQAIQLDPKDIQSRLVYAKLLLETNYSADAIEHLSLIAKYQPKHPQVNQLLVKAYLSQRDYAQATKISEAMQGVESQASTGYFYHGLVLQTQQKYIQALDKFNKAIELSPKAIEPLSSYVRTSLAMKKPHLAEDKLNQVIKDYPDFAIAQNLLGEVQVQQKKNAQAIASFSAAIDKNNQWSLPYRNLAATQLLMKQQSAAIATLEKGIVSATNNEGLVFQLSALFEQQGQVNQAINVYERLLSEKPSTQAANNLALLLAEHKDDQQSLDRALQLIEPLQTSNNASYLDTLGWVYHHRGDNDKALSALLQADELMPQQQLIQYHLGSVYFSKGKLEQARQHLEEAVKPQASFRGRAEAQRMLADIASAKATPTSNSGS